MALGGGRRAELADQIHYETACLVIEQQEAIRQIWADQAAKGLLFSGATAKRAIGSAEALGEKLVASGLEKLELACRGAWVSRSQLKGITRDEVSKGIGRLAEVTLDAVKKLKIEGDALKECERLLEGARGRLLRKADDHFAGWTLGAKTWVERHPFFKWAGVSLAGEPVRFCSPFWEHGSSRRWD